MAAQLVAPTRIDGSIKKSVPTEEAPPTAPATVNFDDNGGVPGAVFNNSVKVKASPHVVPISAGVADGMIIHKTPPVYPKFAQEAHISGKVVLKATITKQGAIEGVQVISGPKILAPAAVDAVKTWRYRPYLLDNSPVSVETSITVVFGTPGK
jgi:protein TonB